MSLHDVSWHNIALSFTNLGWASCSRSLALLHKESGRHGWASVHNAGAVALMLLGLLWL